MNRQEFMTQLEELLQKIPASEREDALAYYNDYFDEAGAENEYQVILELGSPEAVAANILADLQQEVPTYTREDYSSPEVQTQEEDTDESQEYQNAEENEDISNHQNSKANQGAQTYQNTSASKSGMSKSTKILLIILLVFTFPVWISVVGALFGTAVGLIGAAFGVMAGLIGAAVGCVVAGVTCIAGGIICLFANPAEGLICIGIGAILAAIGILLALLGIFAVGVWLPKLVKALIKWVRGLFHRNEGGNEI